MRVPLLLAYVAALVLWSQAVLAQSDYQIRVGDTLTVEVLEDATLNRSVAVLPDGQISFPFAGTIMAAGRTIGQVERALISAISDQFASPPNVFVSVQPAENQPAATATGPSTIDIYLLGEINTPGKAEVVRGTTLMQALALGGGFSRFAATKRVQLRRTDSRTGQQTVSQINYKSLIDGARATQDIELRDGDIILVPERRLFE